MWAQVRRGAVRVLKRFLANDPANKYERAVFNAVRDMAFNFGKAAA